MNIWERLDIAPTTDKKAIQKAYAAQSRRFHPEEKPEEFKQLYEAYQAALNYAKKAPGSGSESTGADFGPQNTQKQNNTSDHGSSRQERGFIQGNTGRKPRLSLQQDTSPELLTYFATRQEKQQELLAAFFKHWEEERSPYKNAQVLAWWKDYLASEDFQNIRWNPQLLKFLTENIDRRFFYGGNEMKLLFWDAYGFREEDNEENKYQGELQKLWKCLHQAVEQEKKALVESQRHQAYEKKRRFYQKLLAAAILLVCLLIPLDLLYKREGGRQYLIRYMEQQYPETGFSKPKKTKRLSYGEIRYTFHPLSHPDLLVTADVAYMEQDRSYQIKENYSPLLLAYYASQYGLDCGQAEYGGGQTEPHGVLYYPDIDHVDAFCETVARMFREHQELTHLSSVGICGKNLLFPDVLLQGGVYGFPFPAPQFYEPWTMDAAELKAQIREAYMIYAFHYEAWNLTPQQYEEWGPSYEKLCEDWDDYEGAWHTMYRDGTGEVLCRLYLPVYSYAESYTRFGDYSLPNYVRKMTAGDAWHYLMSHGADLAVSEDGRGFSVRMNGNIGLWGTEPTVYFDKLESWY